VYRAGMLVVLLEKRGGDKSSASQILTWWQAGLALRGCGGFVCWCWRGIPTAKCTGRHETEKIWNGQSNCKSFTVHLINLGTQSGVSAGAGCCRVLTNCRVSQLSDAFCLLKFKHVHISVIYIRRHLLVQHRPPSPLLWNVDVLVNVSLILSGRI
jgi:hypothetical protein